MREIITLARTSSRQIGAASFIHKQKPLHSCDYHMPHLPPVAKDLVSWDGHATSNAGCFTLSMRHGEKGLSFPLVLNRVKEYTVFSRLS